MRVPVLAVQASLASWCTRGTFGQGIGAYIPMLTSGGRHDVGGPEPGRAVRATLEAEGVDPDSLLVALLLDTSEATAVSVRESGRFVVVSDSYCALTGYDRTELVGRTSVELGLIADRARSRLLGSTDRDIGPVRELWLRRKDGRVRLVEFSARKLVGTLMLTVSRDITTRRDAEAELSLRAELLDLAHDAVVVRDPVESRVTFWNREAQAVYGYSAEEAFGQVIHDLLQTVFPESQQAVAAALARAGQWDGDLRHTRKDGGVITVSSRQAMQRDADGRGTAIIELNSDITIRDRVERTLREANIELARANRAKDRFLSSMSHELRTPLNAVLGFTATLLMGLHGPLIEDQTAALRTVQRAGKHLLSLINDLLDLAQIESGKRDLQHELIDCSDLLDEVISGLRPLADDKGLALAMVPIPEPIEILSDRRTLIQILINLVNNAIKFTVEGSVRLEIGQRLRDGDTVTRFAVIDTGHGIAPADQVRLFAAFEQIEQIDTGPFEGTGLGLYISRTLARLIDGEVIFESVLDEGSTFTLEVTGRPRDNLLST